MRIIDTHLHLIYLDRFAYPWLAGEPALNRQWNAPDYFAEATGLGIEMALHMEVDVADGQAEDETRFVLGLDPRIGGAIAAARPEHEAFAAELERLAGIDGVVGVRRVLHTQPDGLSQTARFVANVRKLANFGLNFDLCLLARQLPIGATLAAKCPNVQFVLDHCGNPDIAGGDLAAWRNDIRALAKLPNVAAKISGIVNHARPDWTADDLRPVVEHVTECFGWDRVVFGSDRPVCTVAGTLTDWVNAAKSIVAGASTDEQAKLFHRNAERIYLKR